MNPYRHGSAKHIEYQRGYAAGVGALAGGMKPITFMPKGWTFAYCMGYADAFAKDR